VITLPFATPDSDLRAVQKFVRKSSELPAEFKKLFKKKKLMQNFALEWTNENCVHSDTCGCRVTLKGLCADLKGRVFTSDAPTIQGQFADIIARARVLLANPSASEAQLEDSYFVSSLRKGSNITLIDPPFQDRSVWPREVPDPSPHPTVKQYFAKADELYFSAHKSHLGLSSSDFARAWDYDAYPTLSSLVLRHFSSYHWAFGKTNGRPHWVSTGSGLYEDHKMMNTLLLMQRPLIGDQPLPVFQHVKEILRHYYRIVGSDYRTKEKIKINLSPLHPMYLGSAGGLNNAESRNISGYPVPIEVRAKGKKIDTFEQDVTAFVDFIRTGEAPAVYFENSFKNEYLFSFTKQWNDDNWRAFRQKCRVFVIPSSIYILISRVVSLPRMMRERGEAIRIGSKWSRGGADSLAKSLGVWDEPWVRQLFAGDVDKFDQSVIRPFIDLYWSTHLAYHDETDEDYPILVELCKWLCQVQLNRITHLYGRRWASVHAQVPSGILDTSHMDSFVMLIYLISFCVHTIHSSPEEIREGLEEHFLDVIKMVVYGDDHVFRTGAGLYAGYFSGQAFAQFVQRFFGVTIRDLEVDLPFCSTVKDGYLVKKGVMFLRHYFVPNPYYGDPKYPGQCRYLPYRETRDVMIRVAYSREVREVREPLDVVLSIVSHAYGTYASNPDTYERLRILYALIVKEEGYTPATLKEELWRRAEEGDLGKMRQMGITVEEISQGFPSWETLVRKNVYDEAYQKNSSQYYDPQDYEFMGSPEDY